MNWYFAVEKFTNEMSMSNAGGKARSDMNEILKTWGAQPLIVDALPSRESLSTAKKLQTHVQAYNYWKKALAGVPDGSVVIIQIPSTAHTVLFNKVVQHCKKRGIRLVVLVHDLDSFRMALTPGTSRKNQMRTNMEENVLVQAADVLVVHNPAMADVAVSTFDVPISKVVSLGIFDYLVDGAADISGGRFTREGPLVVAGNLSKTKAGYLYGLPSDVPFALYGVGYEVKTPPSNVEYRGVVPANDLPNVLSGGYGLVWDGPTASTCAGEYGEYLKINNPHKASLYLASGMPIVTWRQAALASFVSEHGCGLVVDSLAELHDATNAVSEEQYEDLATNAWAVGQKLREGYFTNRAMDAAAAILA